MNKVILIGNLTKNPDVATTSSGLSKCNFTLAVTRKFKDKNGEKQTDFLQIITWRKTADICAQYLSKGSKVCVVGEVQTRSYEANDGTKRYVTEIVAEDIEFLSTKEKNSSDNSFNSSDSLDGFTDVSDENFPWE